MGYIATGIILAVLAISCLTAYSMLNKNKQESFLKWINSL